MYLLKNQKHKRKVLWALVFILPIVILALHKTGYEEAKATLIGSPASQAKKSAITRSSEEKDESKTRTPTINQSQEQPVAVKQTPDTTPTKKPIAQEQFTETIDVNPDKLSKEPAGIQQPVEASEITNNTNKEVKNSEEETTPPVKETATMQATPTVKEIKPTPPDLPEQREKPVTLIKPQQRAQPELIPKSEKKLEPVTVDQKPAQQAKSIEEQVKKEIKTSDAKQPLEQKPAEKQDNTRPVVKASEEIQPIPNPQTAPKKPHQQSDKKMIDPRFESLEVLTSKDLPKRNISIKQWKTDNGAQVYFVTAPETPMLDIRLVFDAGSARDAYIPGLAYLANGMLGEGTKNLTNDQIAEQFESLGAQFSNGSYRDMAIASLRTLTDEQYLQPAVKLFTEVVTDASFPDDAINRVKNQIMTSLQYIKQQPGKLAEQAFYTKLYGDHPYSTPKEGTEKSIPSIKKNHLITFYKEYYVAKNLIIAMVGDITQQQAKQLANQITSPMNAGGHAEVLAEPKSIKQLKNKIEFPSSQTHVYFGALGLKKGNPDYPAIYVGNHILGGSGFGSRLFENVREKKGLAYSVGSGFILMRAAGPFLINLQTKANQTEQALNIIKKTIQKFIKEGPTEKELTNAKQNILGSFPLSNASNSHIVGQLGSIGFYQLPLTYLDDFMKSIQKVTTQDIKQAFAKYVDLENMIIITVGPKS